ASQGDVCGAGERRFAATAFQLLPQCLGREGDPLDSVGHLDAPTVQRLAAWHLDRLRELDGGRARRVVDKMPDNYLLLGHLVTLFPRAALIHFRRDVRDVALSCWLTHFDQLPWSVDLGPLARRIRDYPRVLPAL